MASTYSNLKIELIGTGEQVGTWGASTNTNLGTAIEEAIVGSADVAFSSADVTLTLTNTNGSQTARHVRLNLTGTSGGARQLILGSGCQIDKPYIINNGLADAVTVKNTTGTGVVVPAGTSMWVFNNGTNVVEAVNHVNSLSANSLTLSSALPVASGGTGRSTLTANNVVLGNGTSAVNLVAPGSNGNVLTSNGTTWVSSTPASGGDVTGPASATADAVVLFNGTTGKLIKDSAKTLPAGDIVGTSASQTLTNKSIDSGQLTGNISADRIINALNANSAPIYACRSWVNFNGTGVLSVRASGNVSTVADNGTGTYTVNFSTNMPDANYSVVFGGNRTANPTVSTGQWQLTGNYTTSNYQIFTTASTGSTLDWELVNMAVFR